MSVSEALTVAFVIQGLAVILGVERDEPGALAEWRHERARRSSRKR